MTDLTRVPPHDGAAEVAVLGACLLHNEAVDDVGDLSPADFYEERHETIWKAITWLRGKGRPVDLVTLADLLRTHGRLDAVGGLEYLAEIQDRVPTSAQVEGHAQIIKDKARIRAGLGICMDFLEKGYTADDGVEYLSRLASEAENAAAQRERSRLQSIAETLPDTRAEIERQITAKVELTGVPTGWSNYDRRTGGLQLSDLIIFAGRPSMGKTAAALDVLVHAAEQGFGGVLFSVEMSKRQQDRRLLSKKSGVNLHKLRTPKWLEAGDLAELVRAEGHLKKLPIFVDDSADLTVPDIRARSRRLARKESISLIVVDYLQILTETSKGDSRDRQLAEMTRGLKALAKELNVAVLCLSQLNRSCEMRQDKRPMMSDLRESGAIEQDADVVSFLYREAAYDLDAGDGAELLTRKNRNGAPGMDPLVFIKDVAQFVEPTGGQDPEPPLREWYEK